MKVGLHAALGAAPAAPAVVAARRGDLGSGWQRAFDRAEVRAWFPRSDEAPALHAQGATRREEPLAPKTTWLAPRTAAPAVRGSTPAATEVQHHSVVPTVQAARAALSPAGVGEPSVQATGPTSAETRVVTTADGARTVRSPVNASRSIPALPARSQAQAARAESAPRVHVEASPEGLRVWLGLPAGQPAISAAILAELRRGLPGTGERLATVVCNGETIYTAESTLQEQR